ncbi:hypothetical protein, partial [Polaromonas sp.]|uniref:hypothetical protein n=1 Tax=Polaromonas sp. TaxID=1869339 RepID=UPI002731AE0C
QTIGSPFLLLTFLLGATQKKSELPPGNPRLAGKPQRSKQRTGFGRLAPINFMKKAVSPLPTSATSYQ